MNAFVRNSMDILFSRQFIGKMVWLRTHPRKPFAFGTCKLQEALLGKFTSILISVQLKTPFVGRNDLALLHMASSRKVLLYTLVINGTGQWYLPMFH